MNKFALEEFEVVKGYVRFYKLKVNESCPIDEFWQQIKKEGNLAKQLNSAVAIMERVALNLAVPTDKYKNISSGAKVSEYEVKTRDLRIYLFRNQEGAIVVWGGKKSTQSRDINRFRSLKQEYINSL